MVDAYIARHGVREHFELQDGKPLFIELGTDGVWFLTYEIDHTEGSPGDLNVIPTAEGIVRFIAEFEDACQQQSNVGALVD